MRILLFSVIILLASQLYAQKDYFYAEDLAFDSKHEEALVVLNHLIDSGAYSDRPRFAMMTLNLAGTTKRYLKDTVGAQKCFEAAMACYDTLSKALKKDAWNQREYYMAGEDLAWIHYDRGDYAKANNLLQLIGYPGSYYSSTGSDVLMAEDGYCGFRARVYQKLNKPDSAFAWILKIRDNENPIVKPLDSIFNVKSNVIYHIVCSSFLGKNENPRLNSPGIIFCVGWKDKKGDPYSIWIIQKYGRSEILGIGSTSAESDFPLCPDTMSISPDEKYLAIGGSAEGANWVDIIAFQSLIKEKLFTRTFSINPYPGLVYIVGWEKELLVLRSDADLTKLNKKSRLSMPDVFGGVDEKELFLFDPESLKYSKK